MSKKTPAERARRWAQRYGRPMDAITIMAWEAGWNARCRAPVSSVSDFISCGHVGDGPTYSCLLCGQLGTGHPTVLRRALTEARDELVRYIDFIHKSDYREYAAPVEAKVAAINVLLGTT